MTSRAGCEALEARVLFSFSFHDDDHIHELVADAAKGGRPAANAPPIRLDLVVLHEIGHSLGLAHSSDPTSIMYAYYNANYDKGSFASDSAVATFRNLYANVLTSPWKDAFDDNPGNGTVEVSYSYMPDGTASEQPRNTSTLFKTLDAIFGRSTWQNIMVGELSRWAGASSGKVSFVQASDAGLPFNYTGLSQNDGASGDIRIGAHKFDNAGGTLAHAYYPPPNGSTAAGDLHLDNAERWVGPTSTSTLTTTTSNNGKSGKNSLTFDDGHDHDHLAIGRSVFSDTLLADDESDDLLLGLLA